MNGMHKHVDDMGCSLSAPSERFTVSIPIEGGCMCQSSTQVILLLWPKTESDISYELVYAIVIVTHKGWEIKSK